MTRTSLAMILAATTALGLGIVLQVRAEGDDNSHSASKVSFPENYPEGVLYMTANRPVNPNSRMAGPENIAQYREYYVTAAAIEALRKGDPAPSGTTITMVQYRAQLDVHGNPLKDDSGRFIKGELFGFAVKEKRTGWGAEYPPEVRNGEWEFQTFTADKKPNGKINLAACFQCHQSQANKDFLFTFDKMKASVADRLGSNE